jgi:hypothetical protein
MTMIRFLSVLAVATSAAAWIALIVGARVVMICLTACIGPVIGLWTPFFMVKLRRLGNPPLMDPLEPRSIITGRRALLIRTLGIAVAVLGPALAFYGIWFTRLPSLRQAICLLTLVLLTLWAVDTLLLSLSISVLPVTPQLPDEMLEQLQGRAARMALWVENVLLILCVVLTGFFNCSREVMATVFMALFLVGMSVFMIGYERGRRKMVA